MADAQLPSDVTTGRRRRNRMDRFIDGIELLAVLRWHRRRRIFTSVLLRYFSACKFPTATTSGAASRHPDFLGHRRNLVSGTHITVDLVYANVGRSCSASSTYRNACSVLRRLGSDLDLFDKVLSTRADNVLTFDLRLPTWPFFLVACWGTCPQCC